MVAVGLSGSAFERVEDDVGRVKLVPEALLQRVRFEELGDISVLKAFEGFSDLGEVVIEQVWELDQVGVDSLNSGLDTTAETFELLAQLQDLGVK